MLAGTGGYVHDGCVAVCREVLEEEFENEKKREEGKR